MSSLNYKFLQYSCLENPRDGGTWQVAFYGVAQSQTQLKRLSSSRRCNSQFIKINLSQINEHIAKSSPVLNVLL